MSLMKESSSLVRDAWRASKSERNLACLRRSLVILRREVAMRRTRLAMSSSIVMFIVFIRYRIKIKPRSLQDSVFFYKRGRAP